MEFRRARTAVLEIKPKYRVIWAITQLKIDLDALPAPNSNDQISAIEKILELLTKYRGKEPTLFHEDHHDKEQKPL